LPASAILRR
jgi:transposase